MKKWPRYTGMAALVVGLLYFSLFEASTHVVRGWLRGEAFYDGRPTSYWRALIEDDLQRKPGDLLRETLGQSSPTWWQSAKERLHLNSKKRSSRDLVSWEFHRSVREGNPTDHAIVLAELANDPNDKIAGFAKEAPKCTPWCMQESHWCMLIAKYNLRYPVAETPE